MPKIITITANLLAEWTSEFEMPSIGGTARAKNSPRFQVGGKGVNVSRAVSGLGGNSIAVIFPAGHLGNLCQEELVKENFADIISPCKFIPISGNVVSIADFQNFGRVSL